MTDALPPMIPLTRFGQDVLDNDAAAEAAYAERERKQRALIRRRALVAWLEDTDVRIASAQEAEDQTWG